MLNGGAFNTITVPSASNLAVNKEVFVSAWAPLPYLLPAVLVYVGVSMKSACLFFNLLSLILGCIGSYKLCKQLGFDALTVWLTILLAITCRSNFNTNYYNVLLAETLVFAALPWFVLASMQLVKKATVFNFIAFATLCFGMIMLKLSMIVACIAVVIFLIIENRANQNTRNALLLCTAFLLAFVTFKYTYQHKGIDTSTLKGGVYVHTKYENTFVASAAPIASLLNLTDLEDDKLPPTIKALFVTNKPIILLFITALVIGVLYRFGRHLQPQYTTYFNLLISFYAVYVAVFLYFALNENAIDFNYRHFRFLTLLFIPLFILTIKSFNYKWIIPIVYAGVGLIVLYGLATFTYKKFVVNKHNPIGNSGFALNYCDAQALNYLHFIDDSLRTGNNLIMVTNPELALEITHNRQMVSLQYYSSGLNYGWLHKHYEGSVDNLYLFTEKQFLNTSGQRKMLPTLFENYDLQIIKQFEKIIVYKAIKKTTI